MNASGLSAERSFARPFRGVGDRLASWLSAAIGIAPVQVVENAGVGAPRPARPRAVAVVGAGLAGMSAAIRLAERGYRVRLVERNGYLGGKLGAWPHVLASGERVTAEHGFHGFFLHYYNLYALFHAAGIDVADFPLVDDYAIADADGRVESLRGYPRTPPFNALAMALRSPFLNLREARRMRNFGLMRDAFLGFDVEETPERWDGISFAELTDRMGLSGTGFDAIFKVFGHSFFSDSAEVSAAEIVKHFHSFFFANPEGLLFRYCRSDFERAVWQPLERRLAALGGVVELGVEVESVDRDPGSGRFALRLRRAATERPASGVTSSAPAVADEPSDASIEADAIVLAVDPPALCAILDASHALRARHPEVAALAGRVPPGQPYAVLRLWTDRDCAPGRASFTSLCGHYPLDSVTVYHRLERESAAWAQRQGGGIYELHSYTPRAQDARDPDRLTRDLEGELSRAFPELAGMRVHDRYAQVRWDFPSFPVGRSADRPAIESGVPGLLLAGDWVRLPVPAALMEAAVTSGIAAANAIGRADGVAPHPIWSVPTRGILARKSKLAARRAVVRALAVSRPLFWLNSAALCVVAAVLGGRPPGLRAAALVAFASFPLNLFVYGVNDLYDHATDRRNPRKGSVEGALFERAELRSIARAALAVNAPFVALFALTGSGAALAALAALYAVAWAYSAPPLRLKARPGWDSLANAGYVLPLVFACLYLEVPNPPWLETTAFAVWAIGSHALTSVQDVEADRAAGVRTSATALGGRAAAALAALAYGVAGALLWTAHPLVAPLLGAYAAIALYVRSSRRADAAHRAYRAFMALNLSAGFVLTTWIALAHRAATAWAAAAMLLLCAAVIGAVLLVRGASAAIAPRAASAKGAPAAAHATGAEL